jgi:hypothetical protein
MKESIVQAFNTGDLEQLRTAVSNCSIDRWTILDLTYTASARNYPHMVYWLLATYPLTFNLHETLSILRDYVMYYYKTDSWNLIFGQLPATYYNRVATNDIRRIIHKMCVIINKQRLESMCILCIESEYSL